MVVVVPLVAAAAVRARVEATRAAKLMETILICGGVWKASVSA